jgi:MYXO-CTERM domain-containing protein
MRSSIFFATAGSLLTLGLSAHADVVTEWNGTAVDLARNTYATSPNPATRAIAIAHLAAYDAVVAISGTHAPYHAELTPDLPASEEAAAAQAFHDALVALFPADESDLDDLLEEHLDAIADGDAKDNGIALGAAAAADILALRAADGSATPVVYDGSTDIGKWRPTPTGLLAALTPEWADVTPFALSAVDQFRPDAPPEVTSAAYAVAFTEVKFYGKKTGSLRTTEQTNIATFWAQQTQIPFNAIARTLSKNNDLGVDDEVRLFALLNLAIADSRIAVWDAKYEYGFWRPITAIQEADDGNADTATDATWAPFLESPNHPEYVSGHSATGAAAAAVLAWWFGDTTSFSVGSDSAPGKTRTFSSFSEAAEQNAESRVYGGIHFRFSDDAGLELGEQVANHVVDNYLLALPSAGAGGSGGAGGAPAGTAGEGGEIGDGEGGSGVGGVPNGTGAAAGAPVTDATGGAPIASSGGAPSSSGGSGQGASDASGGSTGAKSPEEEGCSCSVPGRVAPSYGQFVLGLVGLGLLARRRRR